MRIATTLALAFGLFAGARDANAERRDCEVVFVRAPDDARLVIESWLKAEPRCSGTIELRVVETESGTLYLIAQRPDGRIHEREVPDAQSAGVLVASWVADDWTSPPGDEEEAPAKVEPIMVNPFQGAPGVTEGDVSPPSTSPPPTGRWLTVAGMIQTEGQGGFGVRFEMDLVGGHTSKWTLGVAAVGVSSSMTVSGAGTFGSLETIDLRALLVAGRAWRLGDNWSLRWSAGVGPMYSEGQVNEYDVSSYQPYMRSADGVSLAYESSLTLARELLSHRWALTAGPAATIISSKLEGSNAGEDIMRSKVELMFMLGARYRL